MSYIKRLLGTLSLLTFFVIRTASATSLPITFEGIADGTSVGSTYSSDGLTFSNATVLTAGISLNEVEFPPHSGLNVATDDGGLVTISFSSPVDSFAGFFTYTQTLNLIAFDASNVQVAAAASLFNENFTSSGNPTNELIQIAFAGGFSSLTIAGDPAGGSFVMDDLTYDVGGSTTPGVAPEPGGIWLFGTGLLALIGFKRFAVFGSR